MPQRMLLVLSLLACGATDDGAMTAASGDSGADTSFPSLVTTLVSDSEPTSDCPGVELVEVFRDIDGDGFGNPDVLSLECPDTYGWATQAGDCDDTAFSINPDGIEVCGNDVDEDCNGEFFLDCRFTTCLGVRADDPNTPTGPTLLPRGGEPVGAVEVWCDMDVDGGGWTLVSSTREEPTSDLRSDYKDELSTLSPEGVASGVWDGIRPWFVEMTLPTTGGPPEEVAIPHDIRFACKIDADAEGFDVDLSFYDVLYYTEIAGAVGDGDSCFAEAADFDQIPARRNNLTGEFLPAGSPWLGSVLGNLVGEDFCTDIADFTVDFNDRGVDGDEQDGTDWGEADGTAKCADVLDPEDGAWFIFARESTTR